MKEYPSFVPWVAYVKLTALIVVCTVKEQAEHGIEAMVGMEGEAAGKN